MVLIGMMGQTWTPSVLSMLRQGHEPVHWISRALQLTASNDATTASKTMPTFLHASIITLFTLPFTCDMEWRT